MDQLIELAKTVGPSGVLILFFAAILREVAKHHQATLETERKAHQEALEAERKNQTEERQRLVGALAEIARKYEDVLVDNVGVLNRIETFLKERLRRQSDG